MPCLSQAVKTELLARRAKLVALLLIAETTYGEALAEKTRAYRLDTAEGSQSETLRKLEEISDQVDRLERRIASVDQRLRGSGVSRINLSRHGGGRC